MRTLAPAALAALALTLAGCGASGDQGPPPASAVPVAPGGAPAAPRPTNLDIPKISAHSVLSTFGLNSDGTLQVPDVARPELAGWYCQSGLDITGRPTCTTGVVPGQNGPAVIIGHADGKTPGIFAHLGDVAVGDVARVAMDNGTVLTFAAYRVEHADRAHYPSATVYGNTITPELRLLSCWDHSVGGAPDPGNNTIVFMRMVPTPPAE